MARGMPSMLALLGLLAVAGYQNRDKISGALNDLKTRSPQNPDGSPNVLGGLADSLGGLFGGGSTSATGTSSGGFGNILSGLGGGSLGRIVLWRFRNRYRRLNTNSRGLLRSRWLESHLRARFDSRHHSTDSIARSLRSDCEDGRRRRAYAGRARRL